MTIFNDPKNNSNYRDVVPLSYSGIVVKQTAKGASYYDSMFNKEINNLIYTAEKVIGYFKLGAINIKPFQARGLRRLKLKKT